MRNAEGTMRPNNLRRAGDQEPHRPWPPTREVAISSGGVSAESFNRRDRYVSLSEPRALSTLRGGVDRVRTNSSAEASSK
jgi:hypothetical protein